MYGFIRGSHLLVRCPKWTPLSSRAFIGITAIISPNFCRSPTPGDITSAERNEFSGDTAPGARPTQGRLLPVPGKICGAWFRYGLRPTQPAAPGRDYIIEKQIYISALRLAKQ